MITDPRSPLAAALEAAADGVALFDADDRFVDCNAAYRRLCAPIADLLTPGVLFATLVRATFERGFAPLPAGGAEAAIAMRMTQHCCLHGAVELRRGERTLLMRESHTPDGGTLQIIADVTPLRVRVERDHQADKMAALATLSSGLAHDINNVLAMIRGYAELAGAKIAPDDASAAHLARIVANVDRAAGMTRALLSFSRRRPAAPQRIDLAGLVTGLRARIEPILPAQIRLEIATAEELIVEGDIDDLRHAIMQIVINARDAMPRGGHLRIALDEIPPGQPELPAGAPSVSHIRLTIADTGVGMDAAVLARIFEPFFTTKPPGGGVGLGLAMAYGAITHSGGTIAVDSRPGSGTTVRIYLPCADLAAIPVGDALASAVDANPAPRRILLAEDEPELREILRRGLESAGHVVIAAANGADALALYQANDIDLLVTDIAMPEMDGLRLAANLTAQHPRLSVIYMTGDPGRIGADAADLPRNAIILWKPFAPSHLAQVVANAA